MPGYMVFDLETTISSTIVGGKRVPSVHGAQAKEIKNDFHTIIYGNHPDRIKLLHSEKGFKRRLPVDVANMLQATTTLVGVNLKFDLLFIWDDPTFIAWLKKGGKIWDCQIAHYLMSGQRHTFPSLAEMQLYYLGVKTKESRISALYKKNIGADEIIKARKRCPRLWKLYCKYSREDGRTPMLIMQKQYKKAKQLGMLPIIELWNEYLLVLCMMEHNGIPVDIAQAERTKQEFMLRMVEHLNNAEDLVRKYWTDPRLPTLNINSGQHASAILFGGDFNCKESVKTGEYYGPKAAKAGQEKLKYTPVVVRVVGMGINPIPYTTKLKTEAYQLDDAVIHKLYKNCKNKDAVEYCKQRKLAADYKKMVNTYINAFLTLAVNGKISCQYNNTAVVTGRLSASKPALQTIPVKDEEKKIKVQGLLRAPKGWTCVQIDYSQLEVYIQGALSKDPALIADIKRGVDFHVKRLAYAENLPYEEVYNRCIVQELPEWKLKRKHAKTISFQKAYGAGPESLAEQTGLSVETIKEIFKREDAEYSGVAAWYKSEVESQIYGNTEISTKSMLADKDCKPSKNGRVFDGDTELVPIRQLDKIHYKYDNYEPRHIGYYQSPIGKRYAFEEMCVLTKRGDLFKYFPPTQQKNYMVQGSAAAAQAASSAEMFQYLLNNSDRVLLVNEIHDSKWFLVRNDVLDLTITKLVDIMTNVRSIFKRRFNWDTEIDFCVETEVGQNFAEMHPYENKTKP